MVHKIYLFSIVLPGNCDGWWPWVCFRYESRFSLTCPRGHRHLACVYLHKHSLLVFIMNKHSLLAYVSLRLMKNHRTLVAHLCLQAFIAHIFSYGPKPQRTHKYALKAFLHSYEKLPWWVTELCCEQSCVEATILLKIQTQKSRAKRIKVVCICPKVSNSVAN